jgi:uncharacterized cupredoxin-like copper-binding protein
MRHPARPGEATPKHAHRVCLLAVTLVAAGLPVSASASSLLTTDAVKMVDFKFVFAQKTVKKGRVTFKLTNAGEATHDLKIAGKKSKLLNPGEKATLTVTFLKPGRYAYLCTIPGHAALGMKGVLIVK